MTNTELLVLRLGSIKHLVSLFPIRGTYMDSNGFRTSGGWTATGVGTVPVPQFDSKQLTAPQLSKLLLPTWQLVNEYTGSSRIDAGLAQRITICYKPSVVIAMQKRRREEGRGGETSRAAAVCRSCRQQGSFGRRCVRGTTIHKQPGQILPALALDNH